MRGISFYLAMVFQVTKAMEQVEAFRWKDRGGTIVVHDRLVPSFTDLHPGSDCFHITTLEAGDDMEDFCRRGREKSRAQTTFISEGPWERDEIVCFSCLPWFPVTGLTNETDSDPSDSMPQVGWGRYEEQEGKNMLSITLEVNHRLVDGIHLGQFYQALTARIAGLEEIC